MHVEKVVEMNKLSSSLEPALRIGVHAGFNDVRITSWVSILLLLSFSSDLLQYTQTVIKDMHVTL